MRLRTCRSPARPAPIEVSTARAAEGGSPRWTATFGFERIRNDRDWCEVYGTNSRLQSPIHAIAEDCMQVLWTLERLSKPDSKGQRKRIEIYNHDFLELKKRPHPNLSWSMLIYLAQVYLDLVGKAPVRLKLDGRKVRGQHLPTQMTPFPPHWINRLPYADDPFFHVSWGDGKMLRIPAGEIIYLYRPDPLNPYRDGLGLARALDDEVNQDEAMSKFNNYYMRHSAFLGAVIGIPGCEDPEELEGRWRTHREGVIHAYKTLITNATDKITVSNLTPKLRELNFQQSRDQSRDFMQQGLRVPPERLGIIANSNRSTIDAADFLQQSKNVKPRLVYLEESWNYFLLPLYGESDLYLRAANPVKETEDQKLARAEKGTQIGVLTVNEARQALGYPPLPGGDVLLMPVNNVFPVPSDGNLVEAVLAFMAQQMGPRQLANALNGDAPHQRALPPAPAAILNGGVHHG